MTSADIIVRKRPGEIEQEKLMKKERKLKRQKEIELAHAEVRAMTESLAIASGSYDGSSIGGGSVETFGTDILSEEEVYKPPTMAEKAQERVLYKYDEWTNDPQKTYDEAMSKARKTKVRELNNKEKERRLAEARGEFERAKAAKKNKYNVNLGDLKYTPTPDEKDKIEMNIVKKAFIGAGYKTHIRDGGNEQANLHLMPALIPIPKSFAEVGGPEYRLKSYAAENVMTNTRTKMVDKLSGRIKSQMLPLYVRNTLIEKNGTSVGGDQTQDVLNKDRRYNHTYGRAVAVFEKTEGGAISLAERERRKRIAKEKKIYKPKQHGDEMATNALVRTAFKK